MPMNAIRQSLREQTSVLFVCDDNSRYSLVCEALVRTHEIPGIRAFSAGLEPADKADPFALSALTLAGVNTDGLWPKHWDGFAHPYRKIVDLVVIIGKDAAKRLPQSFPGEPAYIIWDLNGQRDQGYNYSILHDIQVLRPYVDELMTELQSGDHVNHHADLLAAE